jgi:hypothetical protein
MLLNKEINLNLICSVVYEAVNIFDKMIPELSDTFVRHDTSIIF